MLNANNERELAYVVSVKEVKSLPGYDRVEYARIGAGWWVVVKKDEFVPGSLGIYFEIDSKVPEKDPFMFLEKTHFKVKTQKMCKVVSQGLLMSPENFGWSSGTDANMNPYIVDKTKNRYYKEGDFLTSELNITYADPMDNLRKASTDDKYKALTKRHPKVFKSKFVKWLMKREWGRRLMFFLMRGKKIKVNTWPSWVVKTDEERCQNMPWLFPNTDRWIATEKIDGSSSTYTMLNNSKKELIIGSRNVIFNTTDNNVYTEMAHRYNMQQVCKNIISVVSEKGYEVSFVTIQGEVYGGNIQKRHYCTENRLAIFNIILGFKNHSTKRLNPLEMKALLLLVQPDNNTVELEMVPIVDEDFKLPETCDELLAIATGTSMLDGNPREGLVFRSVDGIKSFKAVSNEYLLKYHT